MSQPRVYRVLGQPYICVYRDERLNSLGLPGKDTEMRHCREIRGQAMRPPARDRKAIPASILRILMSRDISEHAACALPE